MWERRQSFPVFFSEPGIKKTKSTNEKFKLPQRTSAHLGELKVKGRPGGTKTIGSRFQPLVSTSENAADPAAWARLLLKRWDFFQQFSARQMPLNRKKEGEAIKSQLYPILHYQTSAVILVRTQSTSTDAAATFSSCSCGSWRHRMAIPACCSDAREPTGVSCVELLLPALAKSNGWPQLGLGWTCKEGIHSATLAAFSF